MDLLVSVSWMAGRRHAALVAVAETTRAAPPGGNCGNWAIQCHTIRAIRCVSELNGQYPVETVETLYLLGRMVVCCRQIRAVFT
jgi:hypothetical protein